MPESLRRLRRRAELALAERVGAVRVLWRRSMQLRVVLSTLAMSTVVVLVLGLVLQTQIADRLLQGKQQAALVQADISRQNLERDLSRLDPDRDGTQATLDEALDRLTSSGSGSDARDAGAFEAVLVAGTEAIGTAPGGSTTDGRGAEPSSGPADVVPPQLRDPVLKGFLATKYVTVSAVGRPSVPALVVGQPVRTAGRNLQLYLIFPLSAEQRTLALIQSTLALAGLALLGLLAGISSIVTRQVVRPVRQAADVAERFADGHLDERMPVYGDDEVARLAESYNEMAASIQQQIHQLEEFGGLQRRFTSDVSHELRTPLTTVRMAAEVLQEHAVDGGDAIAKRSAQLLVAELDRFESLLGDLLEISRLDAGMAELAVEPVDVRDVVRRAAETVHHLVDATATPLLLDLTEEAMAEVDPRRVERILRNLLANAIDHGESRPIEVRVAADDHAVAVVVRDHGVGLKPGEAGLVFNRFWRADPSRQRRSGGTGLGLAISLEDARLQGGWLQAWGETDQGAVFRLTLPRTAGELLRTSPLPLIPVAGAPAVAEPGIHDAAVTTGTALPPPPSGEFPVVQPDAESAEEVR
ncbi:MtrAB system histidine kinase MtrB [Actinomycetospora atypica]|uniref:Sensor histidine kinase MtrB n=1 Tax=Actinomycetospora atypica TaxID=1290095 RepID=A0ABV9YXW7_9PSEU